MKNTIFFINLFDGPYKCALNKSKPKDNLFLIKSDDNHKNDKIIQNAGKRYFKDVNPNDIVYLVKEFQLLKVFYRKVYHFLKRLDGIVELTVIEPKNGGLIDYHWCWRAWKLSWEKVEIENLMSWLSTLGGAFSALGDFFDQAAERAGRISFYQLKLAIKSGDPSIIARSKLYYSISLIQKGNFREAKRIVLNQYEHAKEEFNAGDPRLYKMCHGIWLKLQYTHQMKLENKRNAQKIKTN